MYGGEGEAAYYKLIAKPSTDIYGGFKRDVIKDKLTIEEIMR